MIAERFVQESPKARKDIPSLLTPEVIFFPSTERLFPKMKLVNTRVFLTEMEERYRYRQSKGREIMLTELPSEEWDSLLKGDFEYVYLLGIYKPSEKARDIARHYQDQYRSSLPDMTEDDVVASPFAIGEYEPAQNVASNWEDFDTNVRDKLHERGVKIALDWVPYDTAVDAPLLAVRPDLFLHASDERVATISNPALEFERIRAKDGKWYNIPHAGEAGGMPWIDKVQLDLSNREVLDYKAGQAAIIAQHCDALRVDMAKLGMPWAILDKWNWLFTDEQRNALLKNPPWEYMIPKMRELSPDTEVIGELYSDREIDDAMRAGFTGAYDEKTLLQFRRVLKGELRGVDLLGHLNWVSELPGHSRVEYSENHDIERAVRDLGKEPSIALAAINALTPHTIWMVQEGQETGSRVRLPMQLKRAPLEPVDTDIEGVNQRLYRIRNSVLFQQGRHRVMAASQAHPNNDSNKDIVLQEAQLPNKMGMVACTNTASWEATCKIPIPFGAREIRIFDLATGKFLPGNRIEEVDENRLLFMNLDRFRTQIAYFSY